MWNHVWWSVSFAGISSAPAQTPQANWFHLLLVVPGWLQLMGRAYGCQNQYIAEQFVFVSEDTLFMRQFMNISPVHIRLSSVNFQVASAKKM
jgi:hypothetical protein